MRRIRCCRSWRRGPPWRSRTPTCWPTSSAARPSGRQRPCAATSASVRGARRGRSPGRARMAASITSRDLGRSCAIARCAIAAAKGCSNGSIGSMVGGPSVPIPKLAKPCCTLSCELRNQRDTSKYMLSSAPLNPKFANRTRGTGCANFGFGALDRIRLEKSEKRSRSSYLVPFSFGNRFPPWITSGEAFPENAPERREDTMFPTTIAGSLPKPFWLAEPNKLWAPWRYSGAELDVAKRDATLLALKAQEDAGIDIVTDGEQSRQHFVHGFLEYVDGIDFSRKVEMGIRADRYKAMVPQVTGELRLKGRAHADAARLARAHTRRKLKFTLPGPMTIVDTVADAHYGDRTKMAMAFAGVLNEEARALEQDGVDVIQFDEPAFNV